MTTATFANTAADRTRRSNQTCASQCNQSGAQKGVYLLLAVALVEACAGAMACFCM